MVWTLHNMYTYIYSCGIRRLTCETAIKYQVSLDFVTIWKQCSLSGNDEQGLTDAISVRTIWFLGLGAYKKKKKELP